MEHDTLDRLRRTHPAWRLHHRSLWVEEPSRHEGRLSNLTPEEQTLFEDLQTDRLGHRVRLEQERIPFGIVRHALHDL